VVDFGSDSGRAIARELETFWPRRPPTLPAFGGHLSSNETVTVGDRSHLGQLGSAFESIARSVGGVVGVTALNLDTGESVSLNGGQRFPMASMVKVPLAVAAMKLVDEGKLHLDQMVALEPSHMCPGHGVIASHLSIPGVSLSLKNLIELSLTISDNTAADAMLQAIGGPEIVTQHVAAPQLGRLAVTRSLRDLLSGMMGVTLPPDAMFTTAMWAQLMRQPHPPERIAAIRAFFNDARDTATTVEMCQLLSQLWRSDGLSPTASKLILDTMHKCRTGSRRLKGLLPPGTRFAHKTGSLEVGLTADMGIIELPAAMGCVAVCAFIMGSADSQERQDRVLARLGRAVYDHACQDTPSRRTSSSPPNIWPPQKNASGSVE